MDGITLTSTIVSTLARPLIGGRMSFSVMTIGF
jgi:hypothetical protein